MTGTFSGYTHRSHIQLRVLFCVAKTAKRYDVILPSLMMFSSVDPYHDLSSVHLDISPSSVPGFSNGLKTWKLPYTALIPIPWSLKILKPFLFGFAE